MNVIAVMTLLLDSAIINSTATVRIVINSLSIVVIAIFHVYTCCFVVSLLQTPSKAPSLDPWMPAKKRLPSGWAQGQSLGARSKPDGITTPYTPTLLEPQAPKLLYPIP